MAQAIFAGATEVAAFKRAGYTGNPRKNANRIAHTAAVQARIAELNGKVERKAVLDKAEALEMLTKGARAAFRIFQAAGTFTKRKITLDTAKIEADPELKAAIREVVIHEDGTKTTIRLHDYREMIALLAKLEGWEAPKDLKIHRAALEECTDEELDAMASGAGASDE